MPSVVETWGKSPATDVAAGRRWVEAYVEYVHYVERLEAVAGARGDAHAAAVRAQGGSMATTRAPGA